VRWLVWIAPATFLLGLASLYGGLHLYSHYQTLGFFLLLVGPNVALVGVGLLIATGLLAVSRYQQRGSALR
jgi:hypothetical protein